MNDEPDCNRRCSSLLTLPVSRPAYSEDRGPDHRPRLVGWSVLEEADRVGPVAGKASCWETNLGSALGRVTGFA